MFDQAQHVQPVHFRHLQIEQHQRGQVVLSLAEFPGAAEIIQRLHAVASDHHSIREPVMLERRQGELDVFRIIFDEQNAFGLHHCTVPFRKLR